MLTRNEKQLLGDLLGRDEHAAFMESLEHDPERRELGRRLLTLPDDIEVVPMQVIAFRMAEIADAQRLSTLGAEAIAAAEHLDAPLCVWEGDDGPGIRAAMAASRATYRTIAR